MGTSIGARLFNSMLLLGAQGIGCRPGCVQHAIGVAETVELLV